MSNFAANEKVLCYHGPLLYEAKVLKTAEFTEDNTTTGGLGPHFLVHYKGWKQTWDEWVPPTRLLKFNAENVAHQKSLLAQSAAANPLAPSTSKATKGTAPKESRPSRKEGGTRGTKRGREDDDSNRKPEMKLAVPEVLKVLLVDDWEAVTKNSQLVSLPRTPNVVDILEQFKSDVLSNSDSSTRLREPKLLLPTIAAGLQIYFDRALGANLLYRFERQQYTEMRVRYVTGPGVQYGQEKDMSAVYGAEHLLRMLVSLPQMVASSTMDAESVSLLKDYVNELMVWMVKEKDRIFQTEYDTASIQYQNVSRS